jgi:hypothetical protein
MNLSLVENIIHRKSDNELELKSTKAWMSGRCRKHPITRKDDFSMVNRHIKERDLIIVDRKAHCLQQTTYNKPTRVTMATR